MEKALSLELSPQAREAIEKYMRKNVPHAYGSESHCLSDFRNWCVDVYEMPSLVCLRNDRRYTTQDREKAIRHMNEYFSEMEPIVTKYNGIINKFIGDAVMAVFGEPINDENHPLNAVRCGYEMLQKVQELDKKWQAENNPVIEIGIGINTGEVFVGNIGSEKRMEYTVIGDTVNLASRLESYNKTYNTHMLISSTTYESAKDFVTANRITDVEIRGKAEKMNIYEITDCIL